MILEPKQKIEEVIVQRLANHASLTATAISEGLNQEKEYTIQAIYKALRNLEKGGTVVKNGRKYSLRLSWVEDLADLAKRASANYLRLAKAGLPPKNSRKIWHFHDLLTLNNFWSQILLLLIKNSQSRVLLTWMPHPWFHLAYSEQEEQYIKSLELTNTKLYLINGGQTFLDRWAEKYWQKPKIEYSNAESVFSKIEPTTYINIIDNYVLSVKLDDKITQEIDNLYKSVKTFEELDISEVFRIFDLKVRASMWLEENTKKSNLYRKRFAKFFGADLKH